MPLIFILNNVWRCFVMAVRGRPKGAIGEESRALLLQVATKEFAQNGYYETKISDIVKGASLTQPVFYLYFKNKEAVLSGISGLVSCATR